MNRRAEQMIADLKTGLPVIVYSWELAVLDLPNVRRDVAAHYRVERDGRVVEVAPRRDPNNPVQIVGWEPVG